MEINNDVKNKFDDIIKIRDLEESVINTIKLINKNNYNEIKERDKAFELLKEILSSKEYEELLYENNGKNSSHAISSDFAIKVEKLIPLFLIQNGYNIVFFNGTGYDWMVNDDIKIEFKSSWKKCFSPEEKINTEYYRFKKILSTNSSNKNSNYWVFVGCGINLKNIQIEDYGIFIIDDSRIEFTKNKWNEKQNKINIKNGNISIGNENGTRVNYVSYDFYEKDISGYYPCSGYFTNKTLKREINMKNGKMAFVMSGKVPYEYIYN